MDDASGKGESFFSLFIIDLSGEGLGEILFFVPVSISLLDDGCGVGSGADDG